MVDDKIFRVFNAFFVVDERFFQVVQPFKAILKQFSCEDSEPIGSS